MADHDDLLARLDERVREMLTDEYHNDRYPPELCNFVEELAAAIRELQAQLEAARKVADGATEAQRTLFEQVETERKAQKEAERVIADAELTIGIHYRERVAAESRLATVEADTIERCARLFDGLTFGRYLHPSITIRALKSAAPQVPDLSHRKEQGHSGEISSLPAPAAAPQNRRVRRLDRRAEPAPKVILETAADAAVSWGHPRQNYPSGPIYRVGTSTGMVIDPADTGGKT